MRPLLLAPLILVAAATLARAKDSDFVVCRQRIDCAAAPTDAVPKNALMIAFRDADFTGDMAWVLAEKPRIIASVNGLMKAYGFPITAREIGLDRYETIRKLPDADVVLKYRGNSFLTKIGLNDMQVNMGGTMINWVDRNDQRGIVLYGPTRHPQQSILETDLELTEIRPVMAMANPKTSASRKRAQLAYVIFHEFVHAAQTRAAGAILSGQPSDAMSPLCLIPYPTADEMTSRYVDKGMDISRFVGHMTEGLMAAGGSHAGGKHDAEGGNTYSINSCLEDKRVPQALVDDLAALSKSPILCGPPNEDDKTNGYPASDYFRLPEFNRKMISGYLTRMAGTSCYAGCYYSVMSAAAAMKVAGYDPFSFENTVKPKPARTARIPEDADPTWWKAVNRQCGKQERRTAAR